MFFILYLIYDPATSYIYTLSLHDALPISPAGSTGTREANRQTVNEWIRTSAAYDAVIDFDEVTRDPSNPTFFLPIYDSGDHLHPNNAGYAAMGQAVPLELFKNGEGR